MRLDKYLKVSRLIKRRTVANEACSASRIKVNGKISKPSAEIKVGDKIDILFGNKTLEIEVLNTSEHQLKSDASLMYRVISEN